MEVALSATVSRFRLRHVPDGRKARLPLLPPVFFCYSSLVLGSAVAAAGAMWNAALLRRWRLLAGSLVLGLAGFFLFLLVLVSAHTLGLREPAALLLVGRLWHFGVGFVLYRAHRLHALGNDVLGGREVPILPCVLVVFALGMILPFPVRMLLLGLITR